MKITEVVITINVHEKPDFLMRQLANIERYLLCKYIIILNCNRHMYRELQSRPLPGNVYVYPQTLEKQRFHGSITQGIVRNLGYALGHFLFSYFLVLSSRSLFYRPLSFNEIEQQRRPPDFIYNPGIGLSWHWPNMIVSKLATYYLAQNKELVGMFHEGLTFTHACADVIWKFLEEHPDMREDIFTSHTCMEEMALQVIATNESEGFLHIGYSCDTLASPPISDKSFVYNAVRN